MSKSKEYKAVKNYIHNELGITKELIIAIVKEQVQNVVVKTINNSYGGSDVATVVKSVLRQEIIGNHSDVVWAFEGELRKMMSEIVRNEFEVSIKQKEGCDNGTSD